MLKPDYICHLTGDMITSPNTCKNCEAGLVQEFDEYFSCPTCRAEKFAQMVQPMEVPYEEGIRPEPEVV